MITQMAGFRPAYAMRGIIGGFLLNPLTPVSSRASFTRHLNVGSHPCVWRRRQFHCFEQAISPKACAHTDPPLYLK